MIRKLTLFVLVFSLICVSSYAQYDSSSAEKLGWKLGSQAYTFKEFTFAETLNKLNEMGLKYVEMYRGQVIGEGNENKTHFTMDEASKTQVKHMLKKHNIKAVNYGVVNAKNETEWRQIFDFAVEMKIETLTAEPHASQLDMVEKLADEYQINVALHNHPIPSYYWHPEIVKRHLEGRSQRMGACVDFGHWVRSGLNPVECLKTLEGRIITCHIKDINQFGERKAHDVPWGAGMCNISGVLYELKRQGFEGVFSIEYEYNWNNSQAEVHESVNYFNRVAYWLSKNEEK